MEPSSAPLGLFLLHFTVRVYTLNVLRFGCPKFPVVLTVAMMMVCECVCVPFYIEEFFFDMLFVV